MSVTLSDSQVAQIIAILGGNATDPPGLNPITIENAIAAKYDALRVTQDELSQAKKVLGSTGTLILGYRIIMQRDNQGLKRGTLETTATQRMTEWLSGHPVATSVWTGFPFPVDHRAEIQIKITLKDEPQRGPVFIWAKSLAVDGEIVIDEEVDTQLQPNDRVVEN